MLAEEGVQIARALAEDVRRVRRGQIGERALKLGDRGVELPAARTARDVVDHKLDESRALHRRVGRGGMQAATCVLKRVVLKRVV